MTESIFCYRVNLASVLQIKSLAAYLSDSDAVFELFFPQFKNSNNEIPTSKPKRQDMTDRGTEAVSDNKHHL